MNKISNSIILIILTAFISKENAIAQSKATVQDNIYISYGLRNIGFNYEKALSDQITLRTSIGLFKDISIRNVSIKIEEENQNDNHSDGGGMYSDLNDYNIQFRPHHYIEKTYWFLSYAPFMEIEPRWYYNLNSRLKAGKKTEYNSGNYLSSKIRYVHSSLLHFSDKHAPKNMGKKPNSIHLAAQWGVKRVYGNRFVFHFAIGPSSIYDIKNKDFDYSCELDLSIGLRF